MSHLFNGIFKKISRYLIPVIQLHFHLIVGRCIAHRQTRAGSKQHRVLHAVQQHRSGQSKQIQARRRYHLSAAASCFWRQRLELDRSHARLARRTDPESWQRVASRRPGPPHRSVETDGRSSVSGEEHGRREIVANAGQTPFHH